MKKAYIASRPVRFDRNYNVGEIIPAEVIAPQMRRKLTEMGRIICVDMPQDSGAAGENNAPEGTDGDRRESSDAPEGAESGGRKATKNRKQRHDV